MVAHGKGLRPLTAQDDPETSALTSPTNLMRPTTKPLKQLMKSLSPWPAWPRPIPLCLVPVNGKVGVPHRGACTRNLHCWTPITPSHVNGRGQHTEELRELKPPAKRSNPKQPARPCLRKCPSLARGVTPLDCVHEVRGRFMQTKGHHLAARSAAAVTASCFSEHGSAAPNQLKLSRASPPETCRT